MRRFVAPAAFVLAFLVAVRAEPPIAHGSLKPLVHVLLTTDDAGVQRDVLQGMIEALQGRRLAAPENWTRRRARKERCFKTGNRSQPALAF